jgi:hypothetical protein
MADEPQATPTIEDVSEPEFDWGQFFATDGDPAPAAQAQPAPTSEATPELDEEEPDGTAALRAQVEELQRIVRDTAATTTEIATKNRVNAAVEAWKQQASPVELSMSDVLIEATSLDDLKVKAELVKRVSQSADKNLAAERLKIEQDLQKQFGLPVTPTYDPIPEKEKMQTALDEGDIDRASAIAMKGMFP